jgi:hypothetical protein
MRLIVKNLIYLFYCSLFLLIGYNAYAEDSAADKTAEALLASTEEMIEHLILHIDKDTNSSAKPSIPTIIFSAPSGSNAVIINKAIAAVKYRLKDPYSARFRNVYVGKARHRPVYGEVNAKNGFGGYTGYSPFIYVIANGKPEVIFSDN